MLTLFTFLKKYFFYNPLYTLTYLCALLLPSFSFKKIRLYTNEEIKQKIEEGKSIIRLGDGEVHIMNGQNMGYQYYTEEIARGLFSIIKKYTQKSDYILCINRFALNKSNRYLHSLNLLRCWMPMKVFFFLYFKKKEIYGDGVLFYYNHSFLYYLDVHMRDKLVILITRKETIEVFKEKVKDRELTIQYIAVADYAFSEEMNRLDEELYSLLEECKKSGKKCCKKSNTSNNKNYYI